MDFVEILSKEFPNPEKDFAFITEVGLDEQTINKIKDKVKELFGFKNIYVTSAGSTITSHCGKGTYGLMFLNDKSI